jgi:hypothetical protein
VSPVYLASQSGERNEAQCRAIVRSRFDSGAAIEVTGRDFAMLAPEPLEEGDGAVNEINTVFKRKIAGLRRLPRRDRIHALKAARDWRGAALKALREKREIERHARYLAWRIGTMKPG